MRKHKSVVAILLAVMMIFTFMPTMAFADTTIGDAVWKDDFSQVKVGDTWYNATKSADENGVTKANATYGTTVNVDAFYYDLTGAKVFNGASELANGTNISVENFNNLIGKAATVKVKIYGSDGFATMSYWTAKFNGEKIDEELKGNVEASLNIDFTKENATIDMDGSTLQKALLVNTPVSVKLNVIGTPAAATYGRYYIDGDAKKEYEETYDWRTRTYTSNLTYDGNEHTLELAPADGYTVSYEKYNKTKGRWEATDSIKVKNVETYDAYRGVYTNSKGEKLTGYADESNEISPLVNKADYPVLDWTMSNSTSAAYDFEVTAAQAETPWMFVDFKNYASSDEAALIAYLQARYEFKVVKSVADQNVQTWEVVDSEAYKADPAKFEKQYDELFSNYNTYTRNRVDYRIRNNLNKVSVHVVTDPVVEIADDISFSGVTTKSFKAKKKTKKLASTKTFQVAAAADSGKVITFTGTSSNAKVSIDATGKVTVKKGLKKGAKVKLVVKAKTTAGNGYKAAVATQTYTIKIK
jgi:hypothetical protein